MRGHAPGLLLLFCALGCSSEDRGARGRPAGETLPADAATTALDDAGGHAASEAGDPCSVAALREPALAITYYVAANEPGADNAACDGLAPSDEGGGHCPFRDFDSERTRALLDGEEGLRVELRAGTYVIGGWDGLRVEGTGRSEAERLVLSAYPGERPVLDVAAPDGQGCTTADAPMQPQCVRQVLRMTGQYTTVQGLTIQNGLGYHAEINGGAHHVFRCNTLHETVDFPMRSDMLKIDARATDVKVQHNDFSKFRSQAIDMTEVFDVLVEDNELHDPIGEDAGATGTKLGARGVIIRNNRVHDLGPSTQLHAFSLGGTGSGHPDDHEAYDVHVVGNRVWNIAGILAQVVSCAGCSVEDNLLWNAGAGVLVSAAANGLPECEASATGCGPSTGTRISGNRMRALDGGGDPAQANVFLVVEEGEGEGLVAGENLYCAERAEDARFGWAGTRVDFEAWRMASGTDASSRALAEDDPDCTAF